MTILSEYKIFALLAILIVTLVFSGDRACAQNLTPGKKRVVGLSDEEKAWIEAHPVIRVGVDHYPPFEVIDGKGG